MKLNARNFGSLISRPAEYRALLLFGPDEGLLRERRKQILESHLGENFDSMSVSDLDEGTLLDDPAMLADALCSFSLLSDKTVVTLRTSSDKIAPVVQSALELEACKNFLLISAGDLPPRSSLRKLFEAGKHIAAFGCYSDDERSLEQIIRGELQKRGIAADRDAVLYLSHQLGNDRSVTLQEIEKIDLYLGGQRSLSREEAEQLTGGNDKAAVDDLCRLVASGNTSAALTICNRLTVEGNYPVTLLRALAYYFEKLLSVKFLIKEGKSMEEAMGSLRPPLFFKQKTSFEFHLKRFSIEKLRNILTLLTITETRTKRTQDPQTILLSAIQKTAFTTL